MIRPNLFLVGSMKAGTSALHAYLAAHPSIFMTTDPKEPTYFLERSQLLDVLPGVEKRGYWRGERYYLELFQSATEQAIVGEASANYSRLNRVQGVPERIARFNPGARILFIMRDPIERTISHYWYMVRFFEERRNMLTAIREEPDYVDTSYYAMQLRPYIALFGGENVFTLTTESLRERPDETLGAVFRWLGVSESFLPDEAGISVNKTPAVVNQVRGLGVLHRFRYSALWNNLGPLMPKKARTYARRFAERGVNRSAVDTGLVKDYLRPIQREQTLELQELLDENFLEWNLLAEEARGA